LTGACCAITVTAANIVARMTSRFIAALYILKLMSAIDFSLVTGNCSSTRCVFRCLPS
jgi:hypothetical protein